MLPEHLRSRLYPRTLLPLQTHYLIPPLRWIWAPPHPRCRSQQAPLLPPSPPLLTLPTPPAPLPPPRLHRLRRSPPVTTTTPPSSAPPPPPTPTAMEVEPVSAPPAIRMTPPQGIPPLPPTTTATPLTSPRPPAALVAMEVETSTVLTSTPHDTIPHQPVDDDTKRMLIAPLVIPSRSPKPSSLPTTTSAEQPSLLTCYAGLFARLPSLGQIMNSQFAHAQELYNHLFAPSTPVADPVNPDPAFHHSGPRQGILLPLSPVLSPTSLTPLSISPHLWQTFTTCHAPQPHHLPYPTRQLNSRPLLSISPRFFNF